VEFEIMALTFPNRSRSYDEAGQRVRFIGHDGMFEIAFAVETDALASAKSTALTAEAGYLAAFDSACDKIHAVAQKAYSHGRKNVYLLTRSDFQ
jgi:hypothetical protein